MPKKHKPAKRNASVTDIDAVSENSRFSLLTTTTTPPQPKSKMRSRKAKSELKSNDDKDIDTASESSTDVASSAATAQLIRHERALARETNARKAAEERLQDECKQLWTGMTRFLRHLEDSRPVGPMAFPIPAPAGPSHRPAHGDAPPSWVDPWGGLIFNGQIALDMARGDFFAALAEAERKAKIPEPPLPLPPDCEPIDLFDASRKKTWSDNLTIKTTRESLRLLWRLCSVIALVITMVALSKLPGLIGGMASVMEKQSSGRCVGFWVR